MNLVQSDSIKRDGQQGIIRNHQTNPYMSHEEQVSKYMKDHRIIELFENMMAGLVYERPKNPKEYMKKHLQQLLKAKADPGWMNQI